MAGIFGILAVFYLLNLNITAKEFGVFKEGKKVILKVDEQEFGVGVEGKGEWNYDWLYVNGVAADSNYVKALCAYIDFPEDKTQSCFRSKCIEKIEVVVDKDT